MNWYELASPNEVEDILVNVYRSKWDSEMHWSSFCGEDNCQKKFEHPVNFEMAEALWGEYSEELFG